MAKSRGVVGGGNAEVRHLLNRTAPEILEEVLYSARVAAASIRKAGGGNDLPEKVAADPTKAWSTLTTHQKVKITLDVMTGVFTQPEVMLRMIEDLVEDSKEGKTSRLGLLKAILMTSPKELTVDVVSRSGIMLVPEKAANIDSWLSENGIKTIEGEVK